MNRRLETLLAERQSQLHAQLASLPRPRAKVTCSMLHETERQLLRGRSRAHWMQAQHAPPAEPPPPPLHAARAARPFSAAPPPAAARGRVRTAAWGHLTAPLPYAHKPRPASALAAHGARPTPAAAPPPAAPQGFRQASPQPSAHAVPQAASSHGFNHPSQASNGFNHPSSQASHGFNHPSSQASNGFNHPSSQASNGFNHPSSQASNGFNHPSSQASNGFNHPSSQASNGFNHPSQASNGFNHPSSQASNGFNHPSSQASNGFNHPSSQASNGFNHPSQASNGFNHPSSQASNGFNHPSSQASNGFNHPSSQASNGFNHPSSQASNGFNHPSSQASNGFNHPSSQASNGFNHPSSQASNGFNHPSSQASNGFNHPSSQASHGLHQGFSQGTSQAASSQSSSHGVPPPSSQASHGFPQGAFSLARPKAGATSSAGAGSGEPSTGRTEGAEAAEGEGAGGEGSEEGAARSGVEGSERRSTASLVQLAVRASSKGGTGVGGGVAQAVGLSELYKLGRSIGEGSFGFVRVAQERISQELVAVKTFEKSRIKDAAARRRIENEIRVLQRMRHPHVVRLFEVFESAQRVHLCMEHVCGGTLYRHLTQHKRLPEPEVRRLLRQLVGAVAYLHHRFIAHRDIKLENVLLDEMKNVKLIDFGFSVLTRTRLKVACGSPAYTAPEILKAHEYDGRLADVWSLGVLTYVMLVGRFPFSGATRKDLSMAIMRGVFPTPSWMTRDPDTLIRRMLVIDPTQRFNIENVRHNAWLAAAGGEHEIVTEHTEARTIEPRVVGSMVSVGFKPEDIEQSVTFDRHDHINTSYLLLAEKRRRLEAASTSGSAAPPAQRSASTPVGSGADPRAPTIKHQPYSAVQGMQRLSIAQRQVATTDVQQTEQVDETRNVDACGGDVHAIG